MLDPLVRLDFSKRNSFVGLEDKHFLDQVSCLLSYGPRENVLHLHDTVCYCFLIAIFTFKGNDTMEKLVNKKPQEP
jgi:hypothetical protein